MFLRVFTVFLTTAASTRTSESGCSRFAILGPRGPWEVHCQKTLISK